MQTTVLYELKVADKFLMSTPCIDKAQQEFEQAKSYYVDDVTLTEVLTTTVKTSHSHQPCAKHSVLDLVQAFSAILKDWDAEDLAEVFHLQPESAKELISMSNYMRGVA